MPERGCTHPAGKYCNGWLQVTTADAATGWLHNSAVSERPVTLSGGGSPVESEPSIGDVSQAGKGFDATTEQAYKRSRGGAGFEAVDRMERRRIGPDELRRFLQQGGLNPGGGS